MTPLDLAGYLGKLIQHNIQHAVMIWGAPGIGKSSVVRTLAESHDMALVDVRLSQLMPSDLRGVPVPSEGVTQWAPPSFLPDEGQGILLLDEINMAPPALQGVAQQLILDRAVGDYRLPDGWFVWAAGNRVEDRASVFDMPAPLANRFVHLEVKLSIADFRQYAFDIGINPSIIGFLSFRPDLLHQFDDDHPNWPSPRSWEMASSLHNAGLSVQPAVGYGAGVEFAAFLKLRDYLPDIDGILAGKVTPDFPSDPSVGYATVSSMVAKSDTALKAERGFAWLMDKATAEWVQLCAVDLFPQLKKKSLYTAFSKKIVKDQRALAFIQEFTRLVA